MILLWIELKNAAQHVVPRARPELDQVVRSPSSDIKVAPSLEGNAAQAWKYDAP